MTRWHLLAVALALLLLAAIIAILVWIRRTGLTASAAATNLRAMGVDLVRLPGRLRHLAADDRVPRRARWMLIGLALYLASPIDLIPDFLPVIGQLDDVILIALVLIRVRRMIPRAAWEDAFPPGPDSADRVEDPR